MIRLLQSFDFRKSPYARPNQRWVCGREASGAPCRLGPDNRGRCRAAGECAPRRDGNRWICTRPQSAGGPCHEGARPDGSCGRPVPPCQPVRSLRARRGATARWAATLAVGLMVLALYGSDVASWVSPGPLTAHHAEIGDCAACHEDFAKGPVAWVRAAFTGVPEAGHGDSRQCLSCHDMGERPFSPHGADSRRLARSTERQRARLATNVRPIGLNLASRLLTEPDADGSGTTCAACHQEHRGSGRGLAAMGDGRCQSCHTIKFASLNRGHPDFEAYPYDRRTGINFDHVGHIRKHFPETTDETPPEQCVDCHTTDDTGSLMRTAGFEQTCASCHRGDVRGTGAAGSTGIPFIAVPGLDVVSLRAADAALGAWPELSDRSLTPFMRALLAQGWVRPGALQRFARLDPLDLRDARTADIAAVEAVAWGVKMLIHDLLKDGPAALRPALSKALGREIAPATASRLLNGLPLGALRAAQQRWFPDLAAEIAAHEAGRPVPMPAGEFADPADDAGTGETTDAGNGEGGQGDILGGDGSQAAGDDILAGEEADSGGDLLGGDSETASSGDSGDDILSDSQEGGAGEGGDLLDGGTGEDDADGGDLLGGDSGDPGGDRGDGGGILSDEADAGGDLLGDGDAGAATGAEGDEGKSAALPAPNPERWSRLGGWYVDYFALQYRPRGHGDPFLRSWLDVAGEAHARHPDGATAAVFDRLAADKAPGNCMKCHSVDRQDDGALHVNWEQTPRRADEHSFTRFAHDPHITSVATEAGCATCHEFAPEAAYAASFDDRSPATFAANFKPVGKETCAGCHVETKAGDRCVQCHDYHVDEAIRPQADTRLEEMAMSSHEGPGSDEEAK